MEALLLMFTVLLGIAVASILFRSTEGKRNYPLYSDFKIYTQENMHHGKKRVDARFINKSKYTVTYFQLCYEPDFRYDGDELLDIIIGDRFKYDIKILPDMVSGAASVTKGRDFHPIESVKEFDCTHPYILTVKYTDGWSAYTLYYNYNTKKYTIIDEFEKKEKGGIF